MGFQEYGFFLESSLLYWCISISLNTHQYQYQYQYQHQYQYPPIPTPANTNTYQYQYSPIPIPTNTNTSNTNWYWYWQYWYCYMPRLNVSRKHFKLRQITLNYGKVWKSVLLKFRNSWNKNKWCGRNTNGCFIYSLQGKNH